jgi:hypothetical protein
VHYIHYNPVDAGICKKPDHWKYSSYNSLISNSKTQLERKEVISWFENAENFKFVHQQNAGEIII